MRRFLILTALIAVLAAACSDDDDAATTTVVDTGPATTTTTVAGDTTTTTAADPSASTTTTTPTTSTTSVTSTTSTTTTTTTTVASATTTRPRNPGQAPQATITWPPSLKLFNAEYDSTLQDFVAPITLSADVDDPDGDIATIEWFRDDGEYLGEGADLDVKLSTKGRDVAAPWITVRVTDSAGNVTEQKVQVRVYIPSDE